MVPKRRSLPSVSIIIPVRNEASTVSAAIDGCLAQRYDGDIEVVIADGVSTDGTAETLRSYATHPRVTVVTNPAGTTPSGLNAALAAATGEVIVRCDAHSVLPSGYVSKAVETLEATGADNVGGIQNAIGTSPMQRAIAYAMTNRLGVGAGKFHVGGAPGPVDTVYLGVFRAETLRELNGFDQSLLRNQDYDLNIRIRERGGVIWFDPGLAVDYYPRDSLRGLARQYFDYGTWKRRVVRLHPQSVLPRQVAPPVLVVTLAGSAVLLATPLRRLGAFLILGYIAALVGASLWSVSQRRDPAAMLTGGAIGTMHLAWGAGFLVGRSDEE